MYLSLNVPMQQMLIVYNYPAVLLNAAQSVSRLCVNHYLFFVSQSRLTTDAHACSVAWIAAPTVKPYYSNGVTQRFTFLYSGMNKLHSSILNYPAVLLNAALSVMQPAFVSIITCFLYHNHI